MKFCLVISAVLALVSGSVDWLDFRATGGEFSLPSTEEAAIAAQWQLVEKDSQLKVSWYAQEKDPRFHLAFDGREKCAGVRVSFLKNDIDEAYEGVYKKSGIFEEGTYFGEKCYYSTILFTSDRILKSGGRRMLPDDEVALAVYLKRYGTYRKLDRDGCDNAKNPYLEQGCQEGYGLVFGKFGKKSKCNSLAPFYSILDGEGTGNLIGFGWLSFSKFSKDDYKTATFYKTLPEETFKTLFPHAPDCLTSYAEKGITAVDVWLSYEAGQKTTCSSGDWTVSHCEVKRSKRTHPDSKKGKSKQKDEDNGNDEEFNEDDSSSDS